MLTVGELERALRRHWEHSGKDEASPTRSTTRTPSWSSRSQASASKAWRTSENGAVSIRPISPSTCAASRIAKTWS